MEDMTKPKFDIYAFLALRPLSWSAVSSFEYDPEQWFQTYIKGIRQQSKEMDFGSMVDKRLQEDAAFLPGVERYPILQHEMKAVLDKKIPLVGYADGFDRLGYRLKDDKTGKKAWDKKRADETGQLTFYCLLLWLTEKIKPENMQLAISWLPTKEMGDFTITFRDDPVVPFIFPTHRTMQDIIAFTTRIKRTVLAMQEYAKNHP